MNNNNINNLLTLDHVKILFSIFEKSDDKIRLVGGCIRDALINKEISHFQQHRPHETP